MIETSSVGRQIVIGSLAVLCALSFTTSAMAQSQGDGARAQQDRQLTQTGSNVSTGKRIALVIGNGAYTSSPPLKNPPNDATLLAATLKRLGFEVTIGTNRAQREMKQLIREFGQRLRVSGGVGLFYFAGHGVQSRGHNFLVPVDAEIQSEADLEDVGVDVNYVLNMMDDAQNALNIVILDACRNNPFGRSLRSAQGGLAQVKAPTGTLIAYATAPDSVAADGVGANSPYAEELTKQMVASGVVLETMFRRVTEQVSARTGGRQEPWVSDNHKGEFYFSKSPATSSPTDSGLSNTPTTVDGVAVEREYWETIRSSNDAQDYQDYLQAYPNGAYSSIARTKLKQLDRAKSSQPSDSQPTNTRLTSESSKISPVPANQPNDTSNGATVFAVRHWTLSHFHAGSLSVSPAGVRWEEAGGGVDVRDNFTVPCTEIKSVKRGNVFNNAWSNDFYLSLSKRRYRFDTKNGTEAKAIMKLIEDVCGRH